MTRNHLAAEHHASAAFHHAEAAKYHREAARHYTVGKDYPHAAHNALVAQVHGLQAKDRGNRASRSYVHLNGVEQLKDADGAAGSLNETQHHDEAAVHHEQAVLHHGQASGHLKDQEYELAAREAHIAQGHAQDATYHGAEAARHHAKHFGSAERVSEPG